MSSDFKVLLDGRVRILQFLLNCPNNRCFQSVVPSACRCLLHRSFVEKDGNLARFMW